jgi:SSS family solute:Na+ symporter
MGISWGALAGAFLGPFVYALYDKKTTKLAVWSSFVAGVGITVLNMFLNFFSSPIVAGAVAMIVSLIIVPIVSRITPQLSDASKDAIFSCYTQTVVVSRKNSLEE